MSRTICRKFTKICVNVLCVLHINKYWETESLLGKCVSRYDALEMRYNPLSRSLFSRFINVMIAYFRQSPTETTLRHVFHFGKRSELRFNFSVPDCGQAERDRKSERGRGGREALVERNGGECKRLIGTDNCVCVCRCALLFLSLSFSLSIFFVAPLQHHYLPFSLLPALGHILSDSSFLFHLSCRTVRPNRIRCYFFTCAVSVFSSSHRR